MPTPPTAREALDRKGIESICDDIISGMSIRQIAANLGTTDFAVRRWLALDASRSARALAARKISASHFAEEALDVVRDKSIPVDRAREIASHMRWMAKTRDPVQFGDKLELGGELTLNSLSSEELIARNAAIAAEIAKLQGQAPSEQ